MAAAVTLAGLALAAPAGADTLGPIDFESPAYVPGSINGQNGWSVTGPYDQAVVVNAGFPGAPPSFGAQSFRISNATTSGSFGDQTFSPSTVDETGESTAANNGLSGGTRQPVFSSEFTIASATGAVQPGLRITASPDRGDGARMSFLAFEHANGALEVDFFDVQGVEVGDTPPCFQCANFVETSLGSYDPTVPHTVRLEMTCVEGPSNDVVNAYVEGALVHTGTSWEDYYVLDTESSPNPPRVSRTVDSLLFRVSGPAAPATAGNGFLVDDVTLTTGPVPVAPTTLVANPSVAKLDATGLRVFLTLSAVLTSDGEPVPGKTISFLAPNGLLIKGPVCTAQTNASGVASCGSVLPGVVASLLSGYDASFAGDTSFAPASAHGTIAVVRLKLL